jgi:hypothetical protein
MERIKRDSSELSLVLWAMLLLLVILLLGR